MQDIQDLTSGQSLLSSYHTDFGSVHSGSGLHDHMVKAHSVNSALSPVLVPQVCPAWHHVFCLHVHGNQRLYYISCTDYIEVAMSAPSGHCLGCIRQSTCFTETAVNDIV